MPLTRRQTIELAAAIKDRMEALAQEIRGDAARERAEPYAEMTGEVHDAADEAAADLAVDVTRAELLRDAGELEELEAAKLRLDNGIYGLCIACGREIEPERLFARPGAPRCLACQARREKTHAPGR